MNIKSYLIRLFLYNTILFAQISGIVTELNTGRPIENVNITDGNFGAVTNSMGKFLIDVPIGVELEFSHIAYQTILQVAKEDMTVKLIPAVIQSDQIIVTAGLSDESIQTPKILFL